MKNYEYHRIGELAMQLEAAKVDREIIAEIMEGGEDILRKTRPEKKADWMRGAMIKMDRLLDIETRKAVREGCACCLGGQRLKTSKAIAQRDGSLKERVEAVNEAKYVGNIAVVDNGEILVRFAPEGLDHYRCWCLPKAEKPLPITYCFCCGGHVKYHLQIVLGKELDCRARSSALSSAWKKPCTFSFRIKG